MPKTFLDFEEIMIDPNDIKNVSRSEEWNEKDERMDYTILFNAPKYDDIPFLKRFKFPFPTLQQRDMAWIELRAKLEEMEIEFI